MNEAVLKINDISIYGFGLLATLSFLWGSFVFYKKALESHFEDFHILDSVVMSGFWAFIIGRLAFVALNMSTFWNHFSRILLLSNYPGIDRWGAVAGIALGIFFSIRRIKARFLDWFDLTCLGILSGGAVFFSGLFLLTRVYGYLIEAVLYLALFALLWNVEDKYRMFEWYRAKRTSARSGLISGFSISFWGLMLIFENAVLRQMNLAGTLWGSLLFVGGLVLVYIRSGRTVAEDIKNIFKHGRK
jgi:hypothetical protein